MRARAASLVLGGVAYAAALSLVIQLASTSGFLTGVGLPAGFTRTGGYDSKLPGIAAVDPDQMAGAVAEASGGPPTIATPPPPPQPPVAASTRPAPAAAGTGARTAAVPITAPAVTVPAGIPPQYVALYLSLPPSTQAQIQAALQKQKTGSGD